MWNNFATDSGSALLSDGSWHYYSHFTECPFSAVVSALILFFCIFMSYFICCRFRVMGKMRNCGMRKVKCGIENAEWRWLVKRQTTWPPSFRRLPQWHGNRQGGKMQTSNAENASIQCVIQCGGGALLCNADCRCKYNHCPLTFSQTLC